MEYSKKNNLEQKLNRTIVTALNDNVFSGISLAVSRAVNNRRQRIIINKGKTTFEKCSQSIDNNVFFDLASLTKPLVTVLSVFQLVRENKLSLENKLADIFPHKRFQNHGDVTIGQLLSHSSGMSAHKEFFLRDDLQKKINRKKAVIEAVLNEEPEYKSGEKHLYSDLGYMVLGEVVEYVSTQPLNEFWYENVCKPLQMTKVFSFPQTVGDKAIFAATGECPWSHQKLEGVVHDDNCRFMGKVAGHAGLFGTVEGVCTLCERILESIRPGNLENPFFKGLDSWAKRIGRSNWSYGFDMVSALGSSAGKYFSTTSIGHLGFTGVSFWIDPEKEIIIVMLTNRVLNSSSNSEIKKFRPLIHDKIMEYFYG